MNCMSMVLNSDPQQRLAPTFLLHIVRQNKFLHKTPLWSKLSLMTVIYRIVTADTIHPTLIIVFTFLIILNSPTRCPLCQYWLLAAAWNWFVNDQRQESDAEKTVAGRDEGGQAGVLSCEYKDSPEPNTNTDGHDGRKKTQKQHHRKTKLKAAIMAQDLGRTKLWAGRYWCCSLVQAGYSLSQPPPSQ